MNKKRNFFTKYSVVEFCSIFLLIAALFMWFQPFLVSERTFGGINSITLTGFEMAFGAEKSYIVAAPGNPYIKIIYKANYAMCITLGFLLLSLVLQIVTIPLRINKRISYKTWFIMNLLSVICCLVSSVMVFFSVNLFAITNEGGPVGFLSNGSILTGVFTLFTTLMLILNFFADGYKKEEKSKIS